MGVSFLDLLPAVQAPLERLAQTPVIRFFNDTVWIFAVVETLHLLSLAALGGTVLTLNLRLAGVILRDVPVETIERGIRPWFRLGIYGLLLTGVAMAATTARTLLPSAAFLIKMVALVGALLLSGVVLRRARRGGEVTGRIGAVAALVALALWGTALTLFAGTTGLGAGVALIALLAAALIGVTVARAGSDLWRRPVTQVLAFASSLSWVTVAVAGRWLGFS
jgi:hypothetical protein